MIPYLNLPPLRLGPLVFHPFGFLVWTGIVVGFSAARHQARQLGLDPALISRLVIIATGAGIVGAHWVHLIAYHPEEFWANPWSVLRVWAGISSYGCFISSAIAVAVYVRWKKIPFLPYADVLTFAFIHAWFFARLGCTIAHDHPGTPSQFWLAVKFPGGPRHDLGFYEFLLCFLWLPLVHWLGRKKKIDDPPRGTLTHAMLVAYAVPRFFLDFLRASDLAYSDARYVGLTPAQYGCIFFTIIGLRFLLKIARPLLHEPSRTYSSVRAFGRD